MVESGEVYYDEVFDSEVTVVSVEPDTIEIDDNVGDGGTREVRREIDWEHNVSVGRYQKVGEAEVDVESMEPEQGEEELKDSIFDF